MSPSSLSQAIESPGAAWRATVEAFPEDTRHLYVHQDHCVRVSAHDRPFIDVAGLAALTFTGTGDELRARADGLAAAGLTELLYLPAGPDIAGEMTRMAAVFA